MRHRKLRSDEGQPPENDEQAWLISYADLMTLIACFFILMMAFANYDPPGFQKKAQKIAEYFGAKKQRQVEDNLDEIEKDLKQKPIKQEVKVKRMDNYLEITMRGSTLFKPAQTTLGGESLIVLDALIQIIKEKSNAYRILVEGHSDDSPVGSGPYRSNWELSSARAAAVIHRFEKFGFQSNQMVAVGFGSTKPLAPNRDSEGRAIAANMKLNRRVVIKVLEPKVLTGRSVKMGFGHYFEEKQLKSPPSEDYYLPRGQNPEDVTPPE